MPNPLESKPAGDKPAAKPPLLDRAFGPNTQKAVDKSYELFVPSKESFAKPSTLMSELQRIGEEHKATTTRGAVNLVKEQTGHDISLQVQEFELKTLLKEIFGRIPTEAIERVGTSETSHSADPRRSPRVVVDGGSVTFEQLQQLRRINDQRGREGRPLLPPSYLSSFKSTPATLPNTQRPATLPNDPEQPGHPVIVTFIDP